MHDEEYISVSELNNYIKTYLENNYFLQDVYVRGEISNFKLHQSGTLYFAIKDEKCAINVVMFRNYAVKLQTPLKDGDEVLIKGRISVYEARGTFSINATEVIFDSKGMLLIKFEELKKKLLAEGLFDEQFKKPLPKYPFKIGLITAPYGAAIQDMLRTIKNRWPIAQIYIFPTLVQGNEAKNDLVKNIQIADNYHLDVLICGRGGGSIEDLWPFNEEIVARAFYECKTPIISAVGHEIDISISDYVADARGLTPTDGAVKATPNISDVITKILDYKSKLIQSFKRYLDNLKTKIANYQNSYVLTNPTKIYENYRYKIDELESRLLGLIKELTHKYYLIIKDNSNNLNKSMNLVINDSHKKMSMLIGKLDALSPLKVLNRGYSFITYNKQIIKSVNDINIDDQIDLSLKDGNIKAKVISKETNRNG